MYLLMTNIFMKTSEMGPMLLTERSARPSSYHRFILAGGMEEIFTLSEAMLELPSSDAPLKWMKRMCAEEPMLRYTYGSIFQQEQAVRWSIPNFLEDPEAPNDPCSRHLYTQPMVAEFERAEELDDLDFLAQTFLRAWTCRADVALAPRIYAGFWDPDIDPAGAHASWEWIEPDVNTGRRVLF